MDDTLSRIEQFRQMVSADPTNELGHFSLGRALLDAGLTSQAVVCLEKAIELNPNLGRAYELLGQGLLQLGMTGEAVAVLSRGVVVANQRGERLSRDAMIQSLKSLDAPVPELGVAPEAAQTAREDQVVCTRCGQVAAKLARAPFRNAQGKLIVDHVCGSCWRQWVEMGTKVINELRLSMNEPEAQTVYERHMLEFLNLSDQAKGNK